MRIVIFGANGKTGRLLVEQALEQGHAVFAFIRRPGSLSIDHPNLKITVGHLNETLKIRDIVAGADACISAMGGKSLFKRSLEITNGLDNIISIMKSENVKRIIYLSSIGAGESKNLIPQPARFFIVNLFLKTPLSDHNLNENRLIYSNLDWTIVRPASLIDDEMKNNINHGISKVTLKGNPKISRASVANFILKQLIDPTYIHKCVWVYE